MDIALNFIKKSLEHRAQTVVIFQKNLADGGEGAPVAWKVIRRRDAVQVRLAQHRRRLSAPLFKRGERAWTSD